MHDEHSDPGHSAPFQDEHACSSHSSPLVTELREHVPFSVSAVAIGLIVAGIICVLGFASQGGGEAIHDAAHAGHEHAHSPAQLLFHLFHPAHMLFSALATTAMFCRYERNTGKAIVIGLIGAIGVCGVSDIVVPHLSLIILGIETQWHFCFLEHPTLALPFAVIGVMVGVASSGGVVKSTFISHSLHVFVSTMASIFYMVGPLGIIAWIDDLGKVLVFIIIAVMVPCCLSDIVFPLLMSASGKERYSREPHVH